MTTACAFGFAAPIAARLVDRVDAHQVVDGADAAQHLGRAGRGERDAAHVDGHDDRESGREQLPYRRPLAHRRDGDQRDHGEPERDQGLPQEVALPAGGELLAERQLDLRGPLSPQHVDHLRVDGDVVERQPGPDEAGKLRPGGHDLAEQVELARAVQARVRQRRADLRRLPGRRHGLQRGDPQREPDRPGGHHGEGDQVKARRPDSLQERRCANSMQINRNCSISPVVAAAPKRQQRMRWTARCVTPRPV